ncbi:excinuclease ABC subunit C [bacterium (Candidatus Torokbacteria) CG09_land_8_20_14_0_10_42_11]|nr:MAG: excinuclease ABC subunit C [bacterium (Candidatus Torokbacteria) CG09_land_8_20_14_0_10_42_11]
MTNKWGSVLYTGIANNLERRVYEHKNKIFKGFTAKYEVEQLAYYESYPTAEEAILREKQIKAGSRQKKIDLIKNFNPNFEDLAKDWF